MGCIPSKLSFGLSTADENGAEEGNKTYSWDKRKKVDPADYTIENITGKEDGRLPGTINGQQFIIQNCEKAKIYLFDYVNTITIDDCSDCSIYIGPITGSLFIRNCKNCTLVAACGQFRTRDCHKVDIFLLCLTQPIIEASTKMRFGCNISNYTLLNEHYKKAGLSFFNNNWSDIHDFTPVENEKNFTLTKDADLVNENFPLPEDEQFSKVGLTFKKDESLAPLTSGSSYYGSEEVCMTICFYTENVHEIAIDFISKLRKENFSVLYTREVKMEKSQVRKLFGGSTLAALAKKGPVVALIFTGKGVAEACKKTVSILNGGSKMPLAYTTDSTDEGIVVMDTFLSFSTAEIGM